MTTKEPCEYIFEGYYGGRKLRCEEECTFKCAECNSEVCEDHFEDIENVCIVCYYVRVDNF